MSDESAESIADSARAIDDPEARKTFIAGACRGRAQLIESVEKILSGVRTSDDDDFFIDEGDDIPVEKAGDIIGRYRLVKEIGQGGFGSVWLAEQFEPVKREVALKVIKLGMDTRQVIARFEQERQALALMDHPNIARVLDAGATATGRPYFVMDLVRGKPLVEYCDERKLSIVERLELFTQVCTAVQHAHGKGIIHRDLKPSNVLVGDIDGKPHATIIDFGIAKATSSKLTDNSFATAQNQVIGTLHYMSPEQVEGSQDIDTRTDVYSLGVILYELLTGVTPFDDATLRRRIFSEVQKVICEVDPPRPSLRISESEDTLIGAAEDRRVSPQRLPSIIEKDLDWIVMKAIEKDRVRRYGTANDFAADVRRYLEGEAVVAAPPSRAYRLRKFIRRNRGLVTAASIVFVVLVVGVIGTTWGMFQAREQRMRAEAATRTEIAERKQAEAVADLLQQLLSGINPDAEAEGGQSFKEQFVDKLDDAVARLDEFSGEPIVKARLQESLGVSLLALSEYSKAEGLLRPAFEVRKAHFGALDERTQYLATMLGVAYQHLGRYEEALAWVEQGAQAARSSDLTDAITREHTIGMIHQGAGRLDEAIEIFENVHQQLRDTNRLDTTDGMLAIHTLGAAYREVGRTGEAISLLEDALERRRRHLGADHPDSLMSANSLSVAYASARRFQDAARLGEEVRDRFLKRYPPDHVAVLMSLANLAISYEKTGRRKECIDILEDLRDRAVPRLGMKNPTTSRILVDLAISYQNDGRYDDAIKAGEPALESFIELFGAGSPRSTHLVDELSRSYAAVGRKEDAVDVSRKHADAMAAKRSEDDDEVLAARINLGLALRVTGAVGDAIAIFEDVIARRTRLHGENDARTLAAWEVLGSTYHRIGRSDESVEILERVVEGRIKTLGADARATLQAQDSLGACYWSRKQFDKSIPLMEKTLAEQMRLFGPNDDDARKTATNLMVNYGDADRAQDFVNHVLAWYERLLEGQEPDGQMARQTTMSLVGASRRLKRETELIPPLEYLLDRLSKKLGPDHREVIRASTLLGATYRAAGRQTSAAELLLDVLARARKSLGDGDIETLQCGANAASALLSDHRADAALPIYEFLLEHARLPNGKIQAEFAPIEFEYAVAMVHAGQHDRAEREFRRLLDIAKARQRPSPAEVSNISSQIATCLLARREFPEAETLLREVVAFRRSSDPKSFGTGNAQSMLGESLFRQGKFDAAEVLLVEGYTSIKDKVVEAGSFGPMRLEQALTRLVEFHLARHVVDPSRGDDKTAAAWQQTLDAVRRPRESPTIEAPLNSDK